MENSHLEILRTVFPFLLLLLTGALGYVVLAFKVDRLEQLVAKRPQQSAPRGGASLGTAAAPWRRVWGELGSGDVDEEERLRHAFGREVAEARKARKERVCQTSRPI